MNTKKMLLSFLPWVAFSVLAARHGSGGAAAACVVAAALALMFAIRDSRGSSLKIIDATGIAVFAGMAVVAATGSTEVQERVIDFGRGGAAIVLGLVMLASTLVIPFTEQYARESVPREYWGSPVFRSVNRRISAVWGLVVLAMGCGHLVAGWLDPTTNAAAGARPIDLLLNWGLPVVLVIGAMKYTQKAAEEAGSAAPAAQYVPSAR